MYNIIDYIGNGMEKLTKNKHGQWSLAKKKYDPSDFILQYNGPHYQATSISDQMADLNEGIAPRSVKEHDEINREKSNTILPPDAAKKERTYGPVSHSYSVIDKNKNREVGVIDLDMKPSSAGYMSQFSYADPDDEDMVDLMSHFEDAAKKHASTKFGWSVEHGQPGHPEHGIQPATSIEDYFYPAGVSTSNQKHTAKLKNQKQIREQQFMNNIIKRHNDIKSGAYHVPDWSSFKSEVVNPSDLDGENKDRHLGLN